MLTSNLSYLTQDLFNAADTRKCDYRYVFRKMLSRGVSEAYYRYRISEGDKAAYYKSQSLELEIVLDELEDMFDDDGGIFVAYRLTLICALNLCLRLLAIDQAETNADYRSLTQFLINDLPEDTRAVFLAA